MSKHKNLVTYFRNNREELDSTLARKTKAVKLLLIAVGCMAVAFVASYLAQLLSGETTLPSNFAIPLLFIFCALNANLIGVNRLEIIRDLLDDDVVANA
jgi:hypothetical protein